MVCGNNSRWNYTTTTLNTGDNVYVELRSGPCNFLATSPASVVTVNALPIVTAPSQVCMGGTENLSPTTGGDWTSNNTSIATVNNAGVITTVAPGTATFTFINSTTGCTNTTSPVTVNALPVVIAPFSQVCIASTDILSPTSGGTWTSADNGVATVTNSGVVIGVSTGSTTFTFTDASTGCSVTTSSITVKALPVINSVTASASPICAGDQSSLNVDVQGAYLYSWEASPAATAGLPLNADIPSASNQNIPVAPTVTTDYTVTVTNSDGCQETKNVTVTVFPDPEIEITADYCYGPNSIKLYAHSKNGNNIVSWLWSTGGIGNTPTLDNIIVDTAQDVEVVGTTADGCVYVATLSVAQELITDGDFTNFDPANPSFTTEYNQHQAYYTGSSSSGLWPEGDYAVNTNAYSPSNGVGYHPYFHGQDHTNNSTGPRNFLMVNGSTQTTGSANELIIWQQTVIVEPNTDYYFSAYAMNLNPTSPAELQFEVNGVLVGTIADLVNYDKPTLESQVNLNNWVRFYSNPVWNSGAATTAVVRIRNLNTTAGGNDFGLDDISFGKLSPFLFLTSGLGTDAQTVCEGSPITDITYSVGSGVDAPNVTGLPAGVTSYFNGITLRFIGTPTVSPGTYTYEIETTGTCSVLKAIGTITVNPIATVNAGPDQIICSTETNVAMAATLGGSAVTGVWSGGSGTFSTNLPDADYIVGTGDSGIITLTYTANDPDNTGPCSTVSDSMDITIIPYQVANAGTVTTTPNCADTMVNLSANGTIGQWSVTSGQNVVNYSFSDSTSPTSSFTGESGETYTLEWAITNPDPCGVLTSTVDFSIADCSNIYFDGEDDNINFDDNFNLTGAFSFEIWVKPNVINGFTKTIFSKKDANNMTTGFDLRLVNNSISFYANNSMVLSHNGINNNRWYHIAVTFDGSTYKLYFDGIEMDSENGSVPTTNAYNFLVGAMYKSGSKPVNYFNGSLDELRIWKISLSKEQIHQMMNQEIEDNGGNVDGAIVPLDTNGLAWADLAGYYQMNQFTSDVDLGTLNETGFISGRLLNMKESQAETAPLPYTSRVDSQQWGTDNTWTEFEVWDAPNSLGVNGDPIDWNIVKISNTINSGNRPITLLGCIVMPTGKLIIDGNTGSDGTGTGEMLWITHYLKLDGEIDLQGESQLLQKRYGTYDSFNNFSTTQSSESVFEETSSGYIERDQQGQKNSFNYNYWSSPVSARGTANNTTYSVGGILKDGTNSASLRDIDFEDGAYFADSPNVGAIKISNRWIWSYNSSTPAGNTDWQNYYQWNPIGSTVPINTGEGFSMKGTGGKSGLGVMQNYVFVGKPHSGDITTLFMAPQRTYLIGNPYPSALDADEFILDNIGATIDGKAGRNTHGNIFSGALYFWDHFRNTDNHILAQYAGGYATYTLMGGIKAIANAALTVNDGSNTSVKRPSRYIPVGQAFFIDGAIDPDLNKNENVTVTVVAGALVFKNSQRVFMREASGTSVFMKGVKAKGKTTTSAIYVDSRPKIRLQFDSPLGYQRGLLVGVDERTTNNFDIGFDAPLNEDNKEDMFWQLGKGKLVIQGVNNFNEDQELPLGLKISKAGLATIKIDELENMDENIVLFIKDKFTGKTHNISYQPFEIALEPGNYLDRFSLIFRMFKLMEDDVASGVLLVEPPIEDHNYHVFMNNAIAELQIKNNGTDEIKSIALYNNLGQTMNTWNTDLNRRIISLPVKLATGVYMVQINTTKGTNNKRIIIE
jgi:hypothetical protein